MKKFTANLFILFLLVTLSFSQNSNLTILCLAAHPDDEDGAALAYYSKLCGYNAYTVFYTRGEGGQNEIGPELNEELGRIREQECYNAAAIQGSHAYFLGCIDFGYSKTAKETFKFWGGIDSVLEKIVYMIRVIRPYVVITNHDTITTKPNRQHGNHQAVGITVYNAFELAAEPNYHSEQFHDGITPWQIKKLYFRVYDTTKTNVFSLDILQKDSSGRTIEDIAWNAISEHKTQGMGKIDRSVFHETGNRKYELVRSDKMYSMEGDDLFTGLTPTAKEKLNIYIKSFPTVYSYRTVNKEDSLRILSSVQFNKNFKIGLVKTYDNTIENVFYAFGVKYDTLSPLALELWDLNYYTTIILDIRTYLYRPDAEKFNKRLLQYVKSGGNILCFYDKPNDVNGKDIFPYPMYITSERVTEEDAKVTVLEPDHIFFNTPNKMVYSDWDGWIQERNIYLPDGDTTKTSNNYSRLLEMNDENDTVSSTSLLYAGYQYGFYTYCSLSLYRQLKIFHEGALKLFMNMISQPNSFVRNIDEIR